VAVAIGLGAGIFFVTIAVTIARYGDLPETIPIHFGLDGKPNLYGPRVAIWVIPAIELLITVEALSFGALVPRVGPIFWLAILVLCFAGQLLIIAAATNVTQRLDVRVFWVVFIATMLLAVAGAFRWKG
jgi:uncharacterized membrane protein